MSAASRQLLVKDLKVFLRDTAQWSQLLLLVALAVVYVYNFKVLDLDRIPYMSRVVKNAYAFVNLAMAAFVLSAVSVRFVFPAVSAEGAAFWIVRSAPVSMRSFLWSKFWTGLVPVLFLATALTVVSNEILGIAPFLKVVCAVAIVFMSFALVGLAAGMGARHPRFSAENLTQVAGSYGGVAFMVLAVLFILAEIALLGWPLVDLPLVRLQPHPPDRGPPARRMALCFARRDRPRPLRVPALDARRGEGARGHGIRLKVVMKRNPTRSVKVGSVSLGAGHPVAVQSMCATRTQDIEATVEQAEAIRKAGAALVRVAVDSAKDVEALAEIRKQTPANLVVDLQENYRLAEKVAPFVDKVRYNPGHLWHHEKEKPVREKVRFLADVARTHDLAIRVGVNCGSVDPGMKARYPEDDVEAMVQSALEHCRLLDDLGFDRYVVSLKDSHPRKVIEGNTRFAALRPDVPLHLGRHRGGHPARGHHQDPGGFRAAHLPGHRRHASG